MFKFVVFACFLIIAGVAAQNHRDQEDVEAAERAELERLQNENAQYNFNSNVNDDINDGQITREETRDGTKVKGSYSYRDGYVQRTVHYEADENGYRVVKEDTQEIGNGPQFNPNGQADIEGSLIGKYSIKLDKDDDEKHYKDVRA